MDDDFRDLGKSSLNIRPDIQDDIRYLFESYKIIGSCSAVDACQYIKGLLWRATKDMRGPNSCVRLEMVRSYGTPVSRVAASSSPDLRAYSRRTIRSISGSLIG